MNKLAPQANGILTALIQRMGDRDTLVIEGPEMFPLRVELPEYFAGYPIYKVAEYGNLEHRSMRVPEMEFIEKDGEFYPIAYRDDYHMTYRFPVELGESRKTGKPYVFVADPIIQQRLVDYANSWLQVLSITADLMPQRKAA